MQSTQNHLLPAKLAVWAAVLTAVTFLVFIICFVIVYTQGTPASWTNIQDFAARSQTGSSFFKVLAQTCMVLFGPLWVVLLNSLGALAKPEKKVLIRTAADFGLAFALLSSLHYFVQITSVRWNVTGSQLDGLEQFVQSNPNAFLLAANMLGWTLFLGLSSLFAAFAFDQQGWQKVARAALLVNGITCLTGGIGFLFQITVLVFVTMNYLMGGAVLVFAVTLFTGIPKSFRSQPSGGSIQST